MSTTSRTTADVRIVGHRPPGLAWSCYQGIHVGVQRRPGEVVGLVPGDADEAVFDLAMDVVRDDQGVDFRGPFVQGRRGERFLYLSWGEVGPDGGFELFRRAKLHLAPLAEPETAGSLGPGARVEASLELTDARGAPTCASIRPPQIRWRVTSTEEGAPPAVTTEEGARLDATAQGGAAQAAAPKGGGRPAGSAHRGAARGGLGGRWSQRSDGSGGRC